MRKKIYRIILIIFLVIALSAGSVVAYLSIREYRPEDIETLEIDGGAVASVRTGDPVKLISWNIGYAGLGKEEDFFMDGGKKVRPDSIDIIKKNMEGILSVIREEKADIVALQEIDEKSKRSYGINEYEQVKGELSYMESVFAYNYKCDYVPYPLPTIGQVASGIAMFSAYSIKEAFRIQLPVSFKWPVRTANLKRGIEEVRIPVEDSEGELVLLNVHLEAFDSGEGKIAQTKMLREKMNEEKSQGNYVVVMGDFNQVFSGTDTSKYPIVDEDKWLPGIIDEEEFGDGWIFCMDGTTPSCRSLDRVYDEIDENFQYYVIDGFILSDNIHVESFGTLDKGFAFSDHNPLTIQITLEK